MFILWNEWYLITLALLKNKKFIKNLFSKRGQINFIYKQICSDLIKQTIMKTWTYCEMVSLI